MSSNLAGKNISEVEILNISRHGIWVLCHQCEYFLSYENYPWFKSAKVAEILNVQLPQPQHLYWPDLDVDLELDSLVAPEKYPLIAFDDAGV